MLGLICVNMEHCKNTINLWPIWMACYLFHQVPSLCNDSNEIALNDTFSRYANVTEDINLFGPCLVLDTRFVLITTPLWLVDSSNNHRNMSSYDTEIQMVVSSSSFYK